MESASRLPRAAVVAAAIFSAAFLAFGQARETAEIDTVTEQYRQAWQRGDLDAVMQFYSPDAKVIGPGGLLAGSAAVRENLKGSLAIGIHDLRHEEREVYGGGNSIVEVTRSVVTDVAGKRMFTLRYMTLWQKTDGRWRIHRDFIVPVDANTR